MKASVERIRADIESIAACSAWGPGSNRLTFTSEYWSAIDYVAGQLAAVGYEMRLTLFGNTRFRKSGSDWSRAAVVVGSHLDAVPGGGRFDGVAGVVAGVEMARLLAESGADLPLPFEVIVFAEEEGSRFGGVLTGSKAAVAQLTPERLGEMRDKSGVSYLEALGSSGRVVSREAAGVLTGGDVAAYFELHIEQSMVLATKQIPVGIVQVIAGIRQFRVNYLCRCRQSRGGHTDASQKGLPRGNGRGHPRRREGGDRLSDRHHCGDRRALEQ